MFVSLWGIRWFGKLLKGDTYPVEALHCICGRDTRCGDLLCDHAAETDGDRDPVVTGCGAPAVGEIADSGEDDWEDIGPETHLGLFVAFVPTG